MTIIADSGSTKTTWMQADTGRCVVTEGLNPHFTTDGSFLAACAVARAALAGSDAEADGVHVHFYGAGCGHPAQRSRVAALLAKGFGTERVSVGTDMLAACRATAGGQPCLVAILGTGSNACFFDGEAIAIQPTSTGYVLGDKGSANHVGRILLDGYLSGTMPEPTRRRFHDRFPMTDAQLLDAVYHRPNPNRFLASLAPFAVANAADEFCRCAVMRALDDFRDDVLLHLVRQAGRQGCRLHFVGGFAKALEPTLRQCFDAACCGVEVGSVTADPIGGLGAFHAHAVGNVSP